MKLAESGLNLLQLFFHRIEATFYALCDSIYSISVIKLFGSVRSFTYSTRFLEVTRVCLLVTTAKESLA